MDYQLEARLIVTEFYNTHVNDPEETQIGRLVDRPDLEGDDSSLVSEDGVVWGISLDQVYVTWFSKTLQNWKVVLSTNVVDNVIYEVTHNGDKGETYVDAYKKITNVVVSDDPIEQLRRKLSN